MAELHRDSCSRYAELGYIAIEALIDPADVLAAREALASVMLTLLADAKAGRAEYKSARPGATGNYDGAWIKRPQAKTALLFEHSFDPMSVDAEAALSHVRNLYFYEQEHPLFQRLVESPRIKGLAERLIGEETICFQTMALVKPPLIGSEKPWHQDNAYFKYAPLEKVVGFWLALDDASADNGCMHVLPGWHRRGGLKHFHAGDCQIMPDRIAAGAGEAQPVELRAGGAMFFSGMLPHRTPPNRSSKGRRALQFHYRGISTKTVEQAEYDRLFIEADGTPASCAAAAAK